MTDTTPNLTNSHGLQISNDDAEVNIESTLISNDETGFNFPNINTT